MNTPDPFETYVQKHPEWGAQLHALRAQLLQQGLQETIKWGAPTYTLDGQNLIGLAAFKHHAAVWFHQGALLEDPAGVLINAQPGKTQAMRQWRFTQDSAPDAALFKNYIAASIENHRAGRVVALQKQVAKPAEELAAALAQDKTLNDAFKALTPYKQKEYSAYIAEAKRADTRQNRLQKITPMIRAGLGLNDRYRSS